MGNIWLPAWPSFISFLFVFGHVAMERVSENMHVVANEPSLALYRLQEHVRKALPFMVEKRIEFGQLHEQLQGRCYDADYAVRYCRQPSA